jgi:hypothetical protein
MSEARETPLAGVVARAARATLAGGNWTASLGGASCTITAGPTSVPRALAELTWGYSTHAEGHPPDGSDLDQLLVGSWGVGRQGCILKPGCQAVNQLRVADDLLTPSPGRQIGDRPTRGVEADHGADGVGHALDDDLLLAVGQLRVLLAAIAGNESVGQLVNLDPDLGVG